VKKVLVGSGIEFYKTTDKQKKIWEKID
jgi:hypothetical protein